MKLVITNLSGVKQIVPGVGTIQAHANPQTFIDIDAGRDFAIYKNGVNGASALQDLYAAGKIDFEYVLEDFDQGRIGVAKICIDVARGDFTGVAAVSKTYTSAIALPNGASYLSAHLDVKALFAGGAVATAIVKSGISGTDTLFDATENVFTGAALSRRYLTSATVGQDLSGAEAMLTLVTTVANISALTSGHAVLYVLYTLVPVL